MWRECDDFLCGSFIFFQGPISLKCKCLFTTLPPSKHFFPFLEACAHCILDRSHIFPVRLRERKWSLTKLTTHSVLSLSLSLPLSLSHTHTHSLSLIHTRHSLHAFWKNTHTHTHTHWHTHRAAIVFCGHSWDCGGVASFVWCGGWVRPPHSWASGVCVCVCECVFAYDLSWGKRKGEHEKEIKSWKRERVREREEKVIIFRFSFQHRSLSISPPKADLQTPWGFASYWAFVCCVWCARWGEGTQEEHQEAGGWLWLDWHGF